jgi:hypothetical protein
MIEFFNNASVSAFFGAFAAFLLVVVNDWWRERRKVKMLRAEIQLNRSIAIDKTETARKMRSLIRDHNEITSAPVLRFNTQFTRQLAAETLHHLTLDQRRSIEALCYTMEAIDDLIADTQEIAKRFCGPLEHEDRMQLAQTAITNWGDVIANLKRFADMSQLHLTGKYLELTQKTYDTKAYEEL